MHSIGDDLMAGAARFIFGLGGPIHRVPSISLFILIGWRLRRSCERKVGLTTSINSAASIFINFTIYFYMSSMIRRRRIPQCRHS